MLKNIFSEAWVFEHSSIQKDDANNIFSELGFNLHIVSGDEHLLEEELNWLPLGGSKFITFNLPPHLEKTLEQKTNTSILTIESDEIIKMSGGAHCLTRPIYL